MLVITRLSEKPGLDDRTSTHTVTNRHGAVVALHDGSDQRKA